MSVLWYKVWYDLWRNKLRTLLVVISIAMGVFAVGLTFGLAEQMLPAMDASHQSTHPSHASMYVTQPVDREILLTLRRVPGVVVVEALNEVDVRYKLKSGEEWGRGHILARDDYEAQTYDVVQLKGGEWPQDGGVSVERMHGEYYGIGIGDQVILEVENQERSYPVTGVIRHPFVPPPSMYDWAWFFGDEEVMQDFGFEPGHFTEIKFSVQPYSPEYVRLVASAIKERLAKQGISVATTVYQDPEKHWGRSFIDGMALVTRVLAALAMLLSVVLVLNTLSAIITQQTNQIGILKAIGGGRGAVVKIYLAGVLVIGLLSLGIALPLGARASFGLTRWFLAMYNIEYDQAIAQPRLVVLQAISALVVPLLAALWPVLHGAGISVRQAISSYGLGGDFGSSWLDRLVERVGARFLSTTNAIALANTFRRKGRLLLSQSVLVIAGVMFLMVMSLSSSLDATLDAEFGRRSHDVIFYFEDIQRIDRVNALAESAEGVDKAGMWLSVPATILHQGQKALDAGTGSQLQGLPLDDPMYKPHIVAGRWLQPGDGQALVMKRTTAQSENIQLGDTINLDLGVWGQSDWQVVGFYQIFSIFGGGFESDELYAPQEAVFQAVNKSGKGTHLYVRTSSHAVADIDLVNARLLDLFQQHHINVFQSQTMPEMRMVFESAFAIVTSMLVVLALIVALVGGIGLMGSLWIGVIERTKEIGIMRSVGARSGDILKMFLLEGLLQGVLSWLIAAPLSMLVAPQLSNALGQAMFQTGIDYRYNYLALLAWLGIVLFVSALASLIPARNAARINIRQSLAYE